MAAAGALAASMASRALPPVPALLPLPAPLAVPTAWGAAAGSLNLIMMSFMPGAPRRLPAPQLLATPQTVPAPQLSPTPLPLPTSQPQQAQRPLPAVPQRPTPARLPSALLPPPLPRPLPRPAPRLLFSALFLPSLLLRHSGPPLLPGSALRLPLLTLLSALVLRQLVAMLTMLQALTPMSWTAMPGPAMPRPASTPLPAPPPRTPCQPALRLPPLQPPPLPRSDPQLPPLPLSALAPPLPGLPLPGSPLPAPPLPALPLPAPPLPAPRLPAPPLPAPPLPAPSLGSTKGLLPLVKSPVCAAMPLPARRGDLERDMPGWGVMCGGLTHGRGLRSWRMAHQSSGDSELLAGRLPWSWVPGEGVVNEANSPWEPGQMLSGATMPEMGAWSFAPSWLAASGESDQRALPSGSVSASVSVVEPSCSVDWSPGKTMPAKPELTEGAASMNEMRAAKEQTGGERPRGKGRLPVKTMLDGQGGRHSRTALRLGALIDMLGTLRQCSRTMQS